MKHVDWLAEQPFTLALSAGFFGFFAHAGVLRALEQHGVRPAGVVGVSAGALAGGLWSAGLDAEAIGAQFLALRRTDFWDPGVPLGGLLRGRKFRALIRSRLRSRSVRDIADTQVPFVPVAHDVWRNRAVPLRQGPLDAAIVASCAVPLMFRPVWIGGRLLVDGGVRDRLGVCGCAPGERVLAHVLPSRRARARKGTEDALGRQVFGPYARVLQIPELPRVGPSTLASGAAALERAYIATRDWLERPDGDHRRA